MITGDPKLTFGELNLFGENEYNGREFTLHMQGDDYDFGAPQPFDVWIKTLLKDGSLVVTESHDNREVSLRVTLEAGDADALQAGEEALFLECSRPSTFEFTPPDEFAATTVFVVVTSHLVPVIEDDLDERRRIRVYGLTLVCEPWTRSVDEITEIATPTGVTTTVATVVDECTSLTGFTGSHTMSVVASGNAVRTSRTHADSAATFWILRTGSIVLTQPYIRVKASTNPSGNPVWITIGGVDYYPVTSQSGNYWFEVPAGTYPSIKVSFAKPYTPPVGRPSTYPDYLDVYAIHQTNNNRFGTRKELQQIIDIAGSARTPGNLTVSHDTTGLGDVIIYTYPPDLVAYSPGLTQYRTAGGALTADTACVSGSREAISGNPTYTIPQDQLPAGSYQVLARMRNSSTGWQTITIDTWVGSVLAPQVSVKVNFPVANTWYIFPLDVIQLPPVRIRPGAAGDVNVKLSSPSATVLLDMPWIFHTEGEITIMAAGAELTAEVQSPTPVDPGGMAYIGDKYPYGTALAALGRHDFLPPQTVVYVVTTDTEDAEAALTYYPRWFTHAGQ